MESTRLPAADADILAKIKQYSQSRGITYADLLSDCKTANEANYASFSNNGKIDWNNLRGFSYEGHMKRKIPALTPLTDGGKFDGWYMDGAKKVYIEAKTGDKSKPEDYWGRKIEDAKKENARYEIYSEELVPDNIRAYLLRKKRDGFDVILYEGFK